MGCCGGYLKGLSVFVCVLGLKCKGLVVYLLFMEWDLIAGLSSNGLGKLSYFCVF